MKKTRAAIIGYGNIGKYVVQSLQSAIDFEIAGIVRRNATNVPSELREIKVVSNIAELEDVDVAILCTPSRSVAPYAMACLKMGINTVDSFDIHQGIVDLRKQLNDVALQYHSVAIVAAGWDPGTDSVIRTLMEAMAPRGITYTNFGPGMSMGHSVAARAIDGVEDALSVTIPTGTGLHRRMVYVEAKEGFDIEEISRAIKTDEYFCKDDTRVFSVEDVSLLKDAGHGVMMERKGGSGNTQNQIFRFDMRINNPALTAQNLVTAARACMRQRPGAYTLIEIPPIDLLPGEKEAWIDKLV